MLISRVVVIAAIYNTIDAALSISVFEQEAPQDEALPLAVYTVVSDVPQYDMNCESLDMDFQVSFFGKKTLGASVLRGYAQTLTTALDRLPISITGYDNELVTTIEAGALTVEDDTLQLRLGFRLRGF